MKGCLIALEGIDGCGKSTQLKHLMNWLPVSGLMPSSAALYLTKEPGGTALGLALRELLLTPPENIALDASAELLLYAADRAQHVSTIIKPALDNGDWVISDRFSGSTIAYQGYGRQLDLKLVEELELIATEGVVPDLTFLLKIAVDESVKRRSSRKDDRIEAEGVEFLEKVSFGFNLLAKNRGWISVDAHLDVSSLHKLIQNEILKYFETIK